MLQESPRTQHFGQFPIWLYALLLLDTFALGGLVATRLIIQNIESTGARMISGAAQGEIQDVLDHLIPFWLGYPVICLLLLWITLGAFVWLKTRWRITIAVTCIMPLLLLVAFLSMRG